MSSGEWGDQMIDKYYAAVSRYGSENEVKKIAEYLNVSESEVQRESRILRNVGKKHGKGKGKGKAK